MTRDWTLYERGGCYPPFTPADFADSPPGNASEPFRREEWERRVILAADEISGVHDEEHPDNLRHPWCRSCVMRDLDYRQTTFDPPRAPLEDWDDQQWEAALDSATETATARIRWWMTAHKGDLPIERAEDTRGLDEQFLDRTQLDDLPTPDPLIEGILPRHSYGILRGRDGTFKSFVALDWALCLATGRPWQGRSSEPVKVLYIAGEGAYGLAARVDAWEDAWSEKVAPGHLMIRKSALNLHRPGEAFSHLVKKVRDGGYGLVVVDTLRRVSGAADANGSDMGAVVDNLDKIKRATLDGTVLVIAHTDKADNDSRGYSGIEDDADFVWHARREEQMLSLSNTKMKDGPDGATFLLQATPHLGSLVLHAGSAALATTTESQIKLLDTMRSSFREGAHSGALMAASGLPKTTYYRALTDLLKAGHLSNSGSQRRPFYELGPEAKSHEVPPEDTASDLHVSHESHGVPSQAGQVPQVPPPLRAGPGTPALVQAVR